jgi:hypothetical protein
VDIRLTIANWTVLGTFLLAVVLIAGSYWRMCYGKQKFTFRLKDRMGKPTWDFTTSWATTLTAVSAFLSTVLGAGELSEVKPYTGLSLFFGILILIAPFVYNVIAPYQKIDTSEGEGPAQSQGYIGTFLITCLLTLWATCGELITVMLMLVGLKDQGFLSLGLVIAFLFFLALIIVGVCFYALHTIPQTVKDQIDEYQRRQVRLFQVLKEVPKEELPPGARQLVEARALKDQRELNPPRQEWALL